MQRHVREELERLKSGKKIDNVFTVDSKQQAKVSLG
eukprot:CAMPEP_0168625884 /NCGR_PEP_ID=MMETSP0449_2-20121227/10292_1 /TAXON_ID=1082188 /ORGANISM="Strombidium rassoulzadegani, Strain ras09" /LENGTH=35 /DNA_ID= /DNA_START= /DNA_END= /DNA_ORIENTATION=